MNVVPKEVPKGVPNKVSVSEAEGARNVYLPVCMRTRRSVSLTRSLPGDWTGGEPIGGVWI